MIRAGAASLDAAAASLDAVSTPEGVEQLPLDRRPDPCAHVESLVLPEEHAPTATLPLASPGSYMRPVVRPRGYTRPIGAQLVGRLRGYTRPEGSVDHSHQSGWLVVWSTASIVEVCNPQQLEIKDTAGLLRYCAMEKRVSLAVRAYDLAMASGAGLSAADQGFA